MKRIGIYLILNFLLVREIYSEIVKFCLLERYRRYETMFINSYIEMFKPDPLIQYQFEYFIQAASDYYNSIQAIECDITMVEPITYAKHNGTLIIDINDQIQDVVNERISDIYDGEIYQELLDDLQNNITDDKKTNDKNTKDKKRNKALPLFMDYGITYYNSRIIDGKPPQTWNELIEFGNNIPTTPGEKNKYAYIAQFNEGEFYYNFVESVLNTNEGKGYKYIEKETRKTLELFKRLFDDGIIEAQVWTSNSELSTSLIGNPENTIYVMRNWSSYLYNITIENTNGISIFKKQKLLHFDDTDRTRVVNKGIYLCITTQSEEKVDLLIDMIINITSKQFIQKMTEDKIFYDIPAYRSLIVNDNSEYCKRVDCQFFRNLQEDQIVAGYNVLAQHNFIVKFEEFSGKCKEYFKQGSIDNTEKENYITIDTLMNYFSNFFEDKFIEFGSTLSIIIIIIIAIEILITSLVAYRIIKYRNFIEIRRSSPLFLVIMLLGIILAFISVLTYIGMPTDFICRIRPYIFVLSFGLTFYSLLLKTFRIKVIFDKVNIQVKDSYLILYLCILLGIELVMVTVWTVLGGMKADIRRVNDEVHYYDCMNVNDIGTYMQVSLIIINALALVYGCYLAYKVKNVYSEYNESKIIGLSIYGIVICMVIIMLIVNISGLDLNTIFLIQSLMIILSADIILIFMFTPKLWKLHINNLSKNTYQKQMPMYIY